MLVLIVLKHDADAVMNDSANKFSHSLRQYKTKAR